MIFGITYTVTAYPHSAVVHSLLLLLLFLHPYLLLQKVFDTSDLPGGVVNIVTGHVTTSQSTWQNTRMWRPCGKGKSLIITTGSGFVTLLLVRLLPVLQVLWFCGRQ